MKNLIHYLLFALVGIVIVTSCKKDKDPSFEELLEGTWYVVQAEYMNCMDTSYNEIINLPGNCDGERCIQFVFTDDGLITANLKEDGDDEFTNGTYTGDEDSFTMCLDGDCVTGTMDIDDNVALFKFEEDDCDVIFTYRK